MIAALSQANFTRPMRASAAPAAEEAPSNPWPALEKGLTAARTVSVNGTGALAPVMEQALQRYTSAGCTFHTDSFKPDPMLSHDAVLSVLEGTSVKVAFDSGAMVRLKSMADLRILDGMVGLGPQVLEPGEKEFLQVWDSLGSRGYAPRHYGSDPVDARADKLDGLRDFRNSSSITLEDPSKETVTAKSLDELKALDYMSGGSEWPLADLDKARTLRNASQAGQIFYRYGNPRAPYDQYKNTEPEIWVGRAGTPRIAVTLEELKDQKATDELLEQARDFHQGRLKTIYEQLKVTDNPPPIPRQWTDMRRKFTPTVAEAAAAELLQAAALGGQSSSYNVDKVWALAGRMGEFARDDYQLACLARGLAPILENQKQEDAERAMLRLVTFERERELTDEEQTTLLTLVNGTRSIGAATEGMDLVRIPLTGETLEEREQVFLNLGQHLSPTQNHRTAEFYRTVMAEKLPADSLATTGNRLGRIHHACQAEHREDKALGAFRAIQRQLREKPHTAEQAEEVVQKFLSALLLGRDVKGALAAAEEGKTASGVQEGERQVIIGGVRVPRRRGTS